MRKIYIIGILLLYSGLSFSQYGYYPKKFFQPISLNGHVKFGGEYRYEAGTTNEVYDYEKAPLVNAGFLLNTTSYFWHPNFLILDLGGEFNPEYTNADYLVIPDRTESRTAEKIEAATTFFNGKPLTLKAYVNYNKSFTNRENLSNIKTNSYNYGGNLSWANRIVPVQLSYNQGKWEETEIQTDRVYTDYHKRFEGRLNRSFSKRDRNEFIYYHNDFRRVDQIAGETRNISDNFDLNNRIFFDNQQRYLFTSLISGTNQRGTDTFRRLQAMENMSFDLKKNFRLDGNYTYGNMDRDFQTLIQHSVETSLRHQLFQSLYTSLFYEYNKANQSFYTEAKNKIGIDARYEKKIPRGHLLLAGNYYQQGLQYHGESTSLRVLNEEHVLTDGEIVLLDKPNAIVSSVVVRDLTGTIIFQLFIDYILIERNAYVEIQRVPGGKIPNKTAVSIDYTFNQPGTFQYVLSSARIHASLSFFNRLVEGYYTWVKQDYNHLKNTDNVTLDYITQNIYGLKLEYKFVSLGAEYETYQSNITPYNLWSYFAQFQGNAKEKLLFSIHGNLRNYHMVYNDSYQMYADVMGNIAYAFTSHTRLTMELGYRKQSGEGIDLDLILCKTEFTANYRKLFLKMGVELYRRIYLGEQINYYNAYIQVIRTFNWNKQ